MTGRLTDATQPDAPELEAAEATLENLETLETRRHDTYPSYRPSGVEWLGDVPEHWDVKRLRFMSRINPSTSEIEDLQDEDEVSFVPMEAVGEYGGMSLEAVKRLDEVSSGFTYFRDDDVVIAKITPCFENGKGSIAENLTNGVAFGTTELHVVRPGDRLDTTFLFYLTISDAFRKLGTSEMYGAGGQKRIPTDFVRDFRAPLPPLEEQRKIARFLDERTAKIDALIGAKHDLLALLKEKRQAVITHAVTKGLDSAAETRPSGIEWLGDVPEHWDVSPLKHVTKLESGHTPSRSVPEYWENCTIPWVSLADVGSLRSGKVDYVTTTKEKVSQLGLDNSSARLLPDETVILSRTASVGFSAIISKPMATTQDFVNWICGPRLRPRFLLHCLRSMRQEFKRLTMGSTHQTIYMPDVEGFRIPLPPLDEQKDIDEFITNSSEDIDALTGKLEENITLLRELRTSLISAAVTGKIDVRGEAP